MKEACIKIRTIGEVSSNFYYDFILHEIGKGNWWSASDIARFVILSEKPGWYLDTDTSLVELAQLKDETFRYGFSTDIRHADISPVQATMNIIGVAYQNHPIIQAILNTMQSTLQHTVQDPWTKARIDAIYKTKSKHDADYWFAFYVTGFVMSYVLAAVRQSYELGSLDLPKSFKEKMVMHESSHESGSIPMVLQLDFDVHMRHASLHAWIQSGAAHSDTNIWLWIKTMGLDVGFDHGKSLTIINSLKTIIFLKENNYLKEWESNELQRKFIGYWIKELVREHADDIKRSVIEVITEFRNNPELTNLIFLKVEAYDCDADKKQMLTEVLKELKLNERSEQSDVSKAISEFFKGLTIASSDQTNCSYRAQ